MSEKEERAIAALANRIDELKPFWAKSPDGAEWQMLSISVSPAERERIVAALRLHVRIHTAVSSTDGKTP